MEEYAPKILTARLLLRPFCLSDAQDMFQNYCHDEEVCEFLTWNPHKDLDETITFVAYKTTFAEAPRHYAWAIVLAGHVVGSIDLVEDFHDGGFELGYVLGKAYWGQGYMSEAFEAVLDFFFTRTDYTYCRMRAHLSNFRSRHLIEKYHFHFDYEDTLDLPKKNTACPIAVYSLTKEEYLAYKEERR